MTHVRLSRRRALVATLALCILAGFAAARCAPAVAVGPQWRLDSLADTTAAPGGTLTYLFQMSDVSGVETDGSPIQLAVTLPLGITALEAGGEGFECAGADGVSPVAGASEVKCAFNGRIGGVFGESRVLAITVAVDPSAHGVLVASFDVSGGGAPPAATVDPTTITPLAPSFGIDAFDGQAADATGAPFTQAGGHPYEISTQIDFDTLSNPHKFAGAGGALWPVEPVKNVVVDLPPGLVGDPAVAATCSTSQLANSQGIQSEPLCSPDSQVGTALIRTNGFSGPSVRGPLPVFNMVPPPNVPARFGFNILGTVVTLDASLRSGPSYALTVSSINTSEGLPLAGTTLTFWGVPADRSHEFERACPGNLAPWEQGPTCPSGAPLEAFLRNPTSCTPAGVGLATTLYADSWANPGRFGPEGPDLTDPAWKTATFISHLPPNYPAVPSEQGPPQGPTGCERVPFNTSIEVHPSSRAAGSPTGLQVALTAPQQGLTSPTAISESDLRSVALTFPAAMHISPAAAAGLDGCSPAQIELHSRVPASCPEASKLGTVTIDTPLLEKPLTGGVYLATPHENPFGSLVSLYLVASGSGVVVKLPGNVHLNPSTGQITATFEDQPQLPFSSVKVAFDAGSHAALMTPAACGAYTTHAVLTSWSGKTLESDSPFTISERADGSPCGPEGFAPVFTAGVQNPVAGAFSPFSLRLLRADTDQQLGTLTTLHLPPGLLANAASVAGRCTEGQAAAAACPESSHVGTVTVGAGAGPDPFFVHGDVYLMGAFAQSPFRGDPFGLAIVTHAVAGPFDLGTVVVRAGVRVNDDGSITTTTEPFPQILEGIPFDLRDVRVSLDRPGFMVNPTSCEPMGIAGSLSSTGGLVAGLSQRFQVGDCASLGFKPRFSVSTMGKTSKANGASFHVHLASNEGPHSAGTAGESNIAKVDVQLPVSLPARLTTLQKACTATQFASNPAGCPTASFVGSAIAHTPILASPLSGPAILVSHGGQAFPDLVLVLQGEGVRLNLTGHTQIKKGITYSHFETVPDAPVASFDLTLPQSSHSALTTDVPGRNLCATTRTVTVTKRVTRRVHGHNRKVTVKAKKAVAASLLMPTTLTAQNGAVIHQNTKIAVTGCAAPKAKAKKARKAKRHG